MNVVLFDYGTGNLHSLVKALESQGAAVRIGADLAGADALVLPGVGAFGAAADRLAPHAASVTAAADRGLPILGICLGMQLLLDASDEGAGSGLGLIPGRVVRLEARRVPHMGWNRVAPAAVGDTAGETAGDTAGETADDGSGDGGRVPVDPLLRGLAGERFYFANGYVAAPARPSDVVATATHEAVSFPAVLRRGMVTGTQFHPEKSGEAGLRLLSNFLGGGS